MKPQTIPTGSSVRVYAPMRSALSGMIGEVLDFNPHAEGGYGVYVIKLPINPLPFFFHENELILTSPSAGW